MLLHLNSTNYWMTSGILCHSGLCSNVTFSKSPPLSLYKDRFSVIIYHFSLFTFFFIALTTTSCYRLICVCCWSPHRNKLQVGLEFVLFTVIFSEQISGTEKNLQKYMQNEFTYVNQNT